MSDQIRERSGELWSLTGKTEQLSVEVNRKISLSSKDPNQAQLQALGDEFRGGEMGLLATLNDHEPSLVSV